MKFDVDMTLATNVTLTKDVSFQIEAKTKGEAKRRVDEMLADLQEFIDAPEGDALHEILMAQGVDFRDTEAYDEVQIDSIGADGDEFEISKVKG